MKTILACLIVLVFFSEANAQKLFIYGEKGEKIYLQETDSLVQIGFKEDASFDDQQKVVASINPETKIIYSKNNRLITSLQKNIPDFLKLNKENSVAYANKSLVSEDGILQFPTDKILVKIKTSNQIEEILKLMQIDIKSFSRLGSDKNSFIIKLKNGESIQIANQLYESGYFDYAQPSFTRLIKVQNEFYPNQWGLNNTAQNGGTAGIDINAPESWTITRGCNNIKVAVIDQGIDLDHPDLTANLLPGFDATDGGDGGINGDCWGNDTHGTCCAGIIGAVNNSIGIIGVAHNCRIIPIRVSYTQNNIGIWDDDWIVNAINHAWEDDDADILSCSWGGGNVSAAINSEISAALNQGRNNLGCIVIFSTGNNNSSVIYPANSNPDIIAVGAMSPCGQRKRSSSNSWEVNPGVSTDPQGVSCDNEKWWGSNYGSELDLIAPGVFIPTTDIQGSAGSNNSNGTAGNYHQTFNGTSSATPHVAGVAALILSVSPGLTQDQVRDIIESTCTKLGSYSYSTVSGRNNGTWNNEVGYGCLNAHAALLRTIELMNMSISGNTIVCSSNAYSIVNLPPLSTVVWSLSPHPSAIQLQNNVPANNQCLVSNPYKYPAVMTLTATITTNCGATIVITKTIESDTNTTYQAGHYYQQACTAYNHTFPSQSGSLTGSSVFLYPGCMTEVSLSQMTGRTVSFVSGSPQPVNWYYSYSNSTLYLQVPTQSGPYIFSITGDGACNSKTLVFFAYSGYSLLVSPNPTSGETTVAIEATLNEDESLKSGITETGFDYDEEWELEVYDNQQNQKIKIDKLKGKSTTIQTNGWKEGVYIVRVKYKNEILQEKLVVTK